MGNRFKRGSQDEVTIWIVRLATAICPICARHLRTDMDSHFSEATTKSPPISDLIIAGQFQSIRCAHQAISYNNRKRLGGINLLETAQIRVIGIKS